MAHKIFTLFLFFSTFVLGQFQFPSEKVTKIIYQVSYHDQVDSKQNPIWVYADEENVLITNRDQMQSQAIPPFEMTWAQPKNKTYSLIGFLKDSEIIQTKDETSLANQEFEFLPETKEILGFTCKKAKLMVNSNTIEIWYKEDSKIHAGPNLYGIDLGLVLEIVRNGNYVIRATEIKKEKWKTPNFLEKTNIQTFDKLDYQDKIWKSRFTTIPVFENQQIHWSEEFEPQEGVMRFANGTIAVKKVKFPKLKPSDLVFVDLMEQSNGDAYDRTGTVFLIPTDKKKSFMDGLQNGALTLPVYENGNGKNYQGVVATAEYSPLIELMRFFTPFGIKHFNERVKLKDKTWHEVVPYRQEISAFVPLLSEEEVYVGVFIGNYDKGGHKISMNFTIHQEEGAPKEFGKVIPLFNTLNVMEMAGQEYATMFSVEKGLEVEFELNEPLKNAQLRYITTGHGGWENGDEFVKKKNTILLDGKVVFDLIPWREDCGSYRLYNPVSGNFQNGLSSSDYSRSNWCPGTVTNPYLIDLGDLSAGKHKIQVKIPQGKPEGTSFSAWNVSGVLMGN